MTTTKTKGIEWAVMRDGRLASLHRTSSSARRAAKYDGMVLSVDGPLLHVGDRIRNDNGSARAA